MYQTFEYLGSIYGCVVCMYCTKLRDKLIYYLDTLLLYEETLSDLGSAAAGVQWPPP